MEVARLARSMGCWWPVWPDRAHALRHESSRNDEAKAGL